MANRRARPAFLVLLLLVIGWGGRVAWQRAHRSARPLASTTCPFWGPPRTVVEPDVQPSDTLHVRVHEAVHAAQCIRLGPIRYRMRSLSAAGKLSLEAPAYCAAAAATLRIDPDSQYVSDRLHTDMIEALSDVADSASVKQALMRECPAIASQPRRTRARRTPPAVR